MLVSWNWLKDYVQLDMKPGELEHRLAMAGLNHENTEPVADDLAIDLEVTSNRPDCLGHIGVAREIAVLWDQAVTIPAACSPQEKSPAADPCPVRIECPTLCYRYTARVVRGAKVGPSPNWLVQRLRTIGLAAVNNVVDVSNYVLMECGQPLHIFDFAQIKGREILVRAAQPGEPFLAIDHRTYELTPNMCVIADRDRAVALGGVMGGADSEVSETTTDLLIEAAEFDPQSIRNTARQLNLHSPSSYRFERGVDPEGVDWASRRCCQLILDTAGGELIDGVTDVVGKPAPTRDVIVLRFSQLKRVLGIDVDRERVGQILTALGNKQVRISPQQVEVIAPSWRRDLTREIDLVEEVARIHGYDQIPEDVSVPMVPSHRSDDDRIAAKVRRVLTAAGFDEAITTSVVSQAWSDAFSPWSKAEPLACDMPMLRGADRLRRSLTPSLLEARRVNQALGNPIIELFEIAKVYLPQEGELPQERRTIGITSGGDYGALKGILEGLLSALNPAVQLHVTDDDNTSGLLDRVRSSKLLLDGQTWGYLGQLSPAGLKQFGLRSHTTIAEVDLDQLIRLACLVPQYRQPSPYPAISQDVNLIVDEPVRWSELASTIERVGGDCLEQVDYRETYRDGDKDGPGKKRLLFSFTLRSSDRTLTGDEADTIRERIVDACRTQHKAVRLA